MKECMNCRYYEKYYTKSTYYFQKRKNGLCQIGRQPKNNHDVCEQWAGKSVKGLRRRLNAKAIEETAADLSQIRQILVEEREEERAEAAAEEQKNR